MTLENDRREDYRILAGLSTISLYIVVGVGLAIIIIGYIFLQSTHLNPIPNKPIRNVLFIVALAVLPATHIIKRSMLSKIKTPEPGGGFDPGQLFQINITISAMCAGISIYGLVAVILGNEYEVLLLFVAISLIAYQFFRLRPKDLEKLRERGQPGVRG
jgi:hypothetical protein